MNRRRTLERRTHAVPVVLDQIHDRQLPETRHVQRFVKGTRVHDGLTHEADADLVAAAVFDREADPCGERHMRADDSMTAEKVHIAVEEVHRSTLAADHTVDAGHHRLLQLHRHQRRRQLRLLHDCHRQERQRRGHARRRRQHDAAGYHRPQLAGWGTG